VAVNPAAFPPFDNLDARTTMRVVAEVAALLRVDRGQVLRLVVQKVQVNLQVFCNRRAVAVNLH